MRVKITSALAQGLEARDKIFDITDELLAGFVLRVNPSGNKVFWIRYTLSNGKRDRLSLGHFGIVTVAQARAHAKMVLADAAKGIDPKGSKHKTEISTLKAFLEQKYIPWSQAHHQYSKDQIQRLYRMNF